MNLKDKLQSFVEQTLDSLYPVRLGLRNTHQSDLDEIEALLLYILDNNLEQTEIKNAEVAKDFIDILPSLKQKLDKDISAIYDGDPAAKSINEIILAYPGFQAIACYRLANYLLGQGVALLPRMITEYAHSLTGVDIHPAATIGEYFCIDHGTGIVIGETTLIGNHVKIYQGVTLGALSIPERDTTGKRHPTIGNRVIIYAQAIILGGDTHIGDHAIIGGNVWITQSVSAHSKVYYESPSLRSKVKTNDDGKKY